MSHATQRKAMKLYHSGQASSLKEAWAMLRGRKGAARASFKHVSKIGKPSSRRRSGRSADHLRAWQKKAAAAMRLHHRTGISLKAAWKRV